MLRGINRSNSSRLVQLEVLQSQCATPNGSYTVLARHVASMPALVQSTRRPFPTLDASSKAGSSNRVRLRVNLENTAENEKLQIVLK